MGAGVSAWGRSWLESWGRAWGRVTGQAQAEPNWGRIRRERARRRTLQLCLWAVGAQQAGVAARPVYPYKAEPTSPDVGV